MVSKAVFDVISIEYQYENEDDTDYWPYTMTVSVEHDENKHFSFTEDAIRAELESYLSLQEGEPVKVVDLTAFYTGTKDPLRGNYEDYEADTFEAREKKIGSIRIVKNPNFPSGTSLQAYIKTNRAELRKVFGNPNMGESGDGKSKGKEWNLVVGGKRVTIYDRREMDKKGTKYFNIGGDGKYSALLVAQALSIHRNERVHAKEIVPKWLEDRRQYQQVKSIDEHPDLTYERAKEYEDNRRRYRAETFDVEFNEWAEQEMMSHGKDISFKDWAEDEGMKHGDVPITEWAQHEDESHDARYGAESFEDFKRKMVGDDAVAGDVGYMEALEEFYEEYLEDFERITDEFCPEPETFEEFQERVLKNDYENYGAEDYQKKMYQDFLDNWDDEWEGSPPTFEEWKELVKDAEDWGGNPKGKLARALQKARENAKKPQKPLKIEKLDAETKQFAFERLTQGYYDDDERFLVFQSNINLDDYYSKADFNENSPYFHSIHSRIDDALEEFHRLSQENHDKYHQLRRKSDGGFIMKGEIAPYLREDNYYAETSRKRKSILEIFSDNNAVLTAYQDGIEQFESVFGHREAESFMMEFSPDMKSCELVHLRDMVDNKGFLRKNKFLLCGVVNLKRKDIWSWGQAGFYTEWFGDGGEFHNGIEGVIYKGIKSGAYKEEKDAPIFKTMLKTYEKKLEEIGFKNLSMTYSPVDDTSFEMSYDSYTPVYCTSHDWEEAYVKDISEDRVTFQQECSICGITRRGYSDVKLHWEAEIGQWEIGEQLEEAQMNAEGKKRSGVLSDPFDELSLDSGDWKGIVAGFGIGLLALFGYSKLRK